VFSSYSFTTSALDGGEWSESRPGRALRPEKGPLVPIVQEAGWALKPGSTQRLEEKFSCLCRGSNLDRPVVQSVLRHYSLLTEIPRLLTGVLSRINLEYMRILRIFFTPQKEENVNNVFR
jgi:hypothetical protein